MAALSATQQRMKDPSYKRWLWAVSSFNFLRQGTGPYLEDVYQDLYKDLLKQSYTPLCHTSHDPLKTVNQCPTCSRWLAYVDQYRKSGTKLQWGNTKLENWSVDYWEVAKTFMNTGQSPSCRNAASTDVSGALNALINCTKCKADHKKIKTVRDGRNGLFHSSTFQLQQPEFDSLIDGCIDLLQEACFSRFPEATQSINKLKELKSLKVELVFDEELEVWREICAALAENTSNNNKQIITAVQSFMQQHPDLRGKLDEMTSKLDSIINKVDSTEAALGVVHDKVDALGDQIRSIPKRDPSIVLNVTGPVYVNMEPPDLAHDQGTRAVPTSSNDWSLPAPQADNKPEPEPDHLRSRHPRNPTEEISPILGVSSERSDTNRRIKTTDTISPLYSKVLIISVCLLVCLSAIIYHQTASSQQSANIRQIGTPVQQLQKKKEESLSRSNTDDDVQQLKMELVDCYSRPKFTKLSPLVDDDTFGYFIESVYVEVSLIEKTIEPIVGKRGLKDNINQQGRPVNNVNQMIPPPGDQRILLTGFVGSGKTSLCLHYLRQWTSCQHGNCDVNISLNKYELVIFLWARELEKSIYQSVANMLYGEVGNAQMEIHVQNIKAILHSNPSSLIILDGYDEATAQQQKMVHQLVSHDILAKTSVIITSRPIISYREFSKWYEIVGFNFEQQQKFISQFARTSRIDKDQQEHYRQFEQRVFRDKNASILLTSPMMAMTFCTMVAAGEDVDFESRIKHYQQLTDYLTRRACFKYQETINSDTITLALVGFTRATYFQMIKHQAFQFSREELLAHVSEDTLDNIIVHLGFMSVIPYIRSGKKYNAYTFLHKSWAEFTAARYVMSLPIADRCTAVGQLFMSGPANLEVLRFVLGLCGQDEPEHVATLLRAAAEVVTELDKIPKLTIQQEMEMIQTSGITDGSLYIIQLITDVDTLTMSVDTLLNMTVACISIKLAQIEEATVNTAIQGPTDLSSKHYGSARVLYVNLLLSINGAGHLLHNVKLLDVLLMSSQFSRHSTVNHLPVTLSVLAPHMTSLIAVYLVGLDSVTELDAVCSGLAASCVQRLTRLELGGNERLYKERGDLDPLAQLIGKATQLTWLQLSWIYAGEGQLPALCKAVGKAMQLKHLKLEHFGVSAQQYSAVLLPALLRRHAAGGVRLQKVTLEYEDDREGENWDGLRARLREVADTVEVRLKSSIWPGFNKMDAKCDMWIEN